MAGENDKIQTHPCMSQAEQPLVPLSRGQWWCAWLIVAGALLLRLAWLGIKPPHFDEGVNGWFIDQMAKQGFYHYDPSNYHGPFHFYVLFLAQTLLGRSVEVMRLPLVLINTATVALVLGFRRFLPWRVCVVAALAFAVSPGMLFFSRYAIHEAWLVFGMMAGVWGAAEMWTRGTVRGLWVAALGITLMVLTKETYIIHFAAFGLALATLVALETMLPSAPGFSNRPAAQRWNRNMLSNTLAVSLLAILFFYSGGFLDPASLRGLLRTFADWFQTGVKGTDHAKAWYYWLLLMARYEWPALIGLAWCVRALWPGMNRLLRLLAIYGCGVLVAYSLVPYKTPWCIISILWPFFFLFGGVVDSAMRALKGCGLPVGIAAGLVLGGSLAASVHLNYLRPTEPGEQIGNIPWFSHRSGSPASSNVWSFPTYVYVQTTNDLFKLTRPLAELTAQDPSALHMDGNILLASYHPLPWVLGQFTAIGYYDKGLPPVMDAGFIVADEDRIVPLEAQLKESYFVIPFQLRDGMNPGKLYLNARRFAPVFPGRAADFTPQLQPTPAETVTPAVPVEKASASSPAP